MAARNSSATIEAAIKSVLLSFPRDTELVVWDDGSTDDTAEKALQVSQDKVTVMSSTVSVGSGVARQRIIAATDSEFVVNQDSDDISFPWRHALQSRLIEDADMAFTAVQSFAHNRLYRSSVPLSHSPEDVPVALLFRNPLPHPTMLARRAALEEIGGYSESRVGQDYELWMRAAYFGKRLRHSGLPSVAYRISASQISGQPKYGNRVANSPQLVHSYARLLKKMVPSLPMNPTSVQSLDELAALDLTPLLALVEDMRPSLRMYYKHLIARRQYGDLGAVVFDGHVSRPNTQKYKRGRF